jgi:MtrB/PioB family decaheme-associated outer membrane protein
MIKKVYNMVLLLSLAAPALAVASDAEIHGLVEAGIQGVDVDSSNSAKFQEYRDVDDGFIGMFKLDVLKDDYFLKVNAENPGLDDQAFDLGGGQYGKFKYDFYYDEMPHNYSFNARSFYSGLGSNRLILPAPPGSAFETSTDTWNIFDYSVQHKKYGGEIEASLGSPFFFSVGVERREQDGTRPFSARRFPSFAVLEFPEPISYATDNLNLKTGYLGENISVLISGFISSFENDNKFLTYETFNNVDQNVVLEPDNDFSKVAADFSWRSLPLHSTLALTGSYANLSSDVSADEINVNANTIDVFDDLNQTTFDGDIDYYSFSTALVSMPIGKLDTRLYYRYLQKDNNSSRIFYDDEDGDNAKELLSFDKNTAGIEAGYRLPFRTKVDAGYEYENIDRSTSAPAFIDAPETFYRYDNPESTTNDTFFIKLKNSSLDWLTAKLKYKHLERDSDFTGVYDPYNNLGVIRFDAANKTMDEVKLGFELYPIDRLDIGLDFTYQKNDYDNNRETRTDDERKNVYLDMAWRAYKKITLSAFVGYESTETDANRIEDLEFDLTPVYAQTVDDDFWTYGIALDIPDIIYKLSLNFSWQYQKSDGSVKFDNSLTGTSLVNIDDSDDYTKKTFEAKATYEFDPRLIMTVGYLYEDYEYSDLAYANYQFIVNNSDYYSGVYFDQNYTANVGYLTMTYKF